MRVLTFAALFMAGVYADDISVPLDDGHLLIRAQFIRQNEYGSFVPELSLALQNETSSPWKMLKLEFDIGALCDGEPRQWTIPLLTGLGWADDHELVREVRYTEISLVGKVNNCYTEIIKPRLIRAESSKGRIIEGVAVQRVDLNEELQPIKAKRGAQRTEAAEQERKAADEQAKKDAEESARLKRLAAERKRREAEAQAQAAEQKRKLRAACRVVYQNTIDRKINDLTVREEGQVRACRALGLYPPD